MGHQNILVNQVMESVLGAHPESVENSTETQNSIDEAMLSLAPFEPAAIDRENLNQDLLEHKATDLACKAAWALYKDYILHAEQAA